MGRIQKSLGTTPSERFLAKLADRSFLSLWSYPNVYRDRAKELCDLLVVCGNQVLIFSDKHVEWQSDVPLQLAWERWYRRAIAKSADQLTRAVNWVRNHPDRLFLDANCDTPFPIELPQPDHLKIHSVIVARGASEACIQHFGSGSGSLGLMPSISRTTRTSETPQRPFFVGNPSPSDEDVFHILDDVTLGVLLKELDTITDFSLYFSKRERVIKNDNLLAAHGEEDLLSIYLKDLNEKGDHDFVTPDGKAVSGDEKFTVEGGAYAAMRRRPEYKRKKTADRISYLWDSIIESFAKNIIADTSYIVPGYEGYHEPSKRELVVRHMALVPRLERRSNAQAIKGAFEAIGSRDRFYRAMLPGETQEDRSTGFFVVLLKRDTVLKDLSDEDYRLFRANLTLGYAINTLRHCPYLERIVGIATEGELSRNLRSEDAIYAEQLDWTTEAIENAEEMARNLEIFKQGLPSGKMTHNIRPLEYPPSHHPSGQGEQIPYQYISEQRDTRNRKQRRAAKARARRPK